MNTWKIDPAHSRIEFKVKHMVVTTLGGHFSKFDSTMEWDGEDLTTAKIIFEADVDSIYTGIEQRDNHLKSDDFFNAAAYPKIKFVSTSITKVDGMDYTLKGDLTIRDKTLPVTLNVVYGGSVSNFYNKQMAGFELKGKLNRKDYGLKWSATTEAGSIVVSEEVKLEMNVEMIKQD